MGKGSHRYKDRCDEKKVRERWPFPDPKKKKKDKAIKTKSNS